MITSHQKQNEKVKFIGCPSYLRGRREKRKTSSGFRLMDSAAPSRIGGNRRKKISIVHSLQGLFFSCSGNGNGRSWNNRGSNGNYWSSTFNSARNARNLNFNSGGVNPQNNNNRYNGFALRPVQHLSISF